MTRQFVLLPALLSLRDASRNRSGCASVPWCSDSRGHDLRLLRLVVLLTMSICRRDAAMRATTRLLRVCVDALRTPALDTGRARTVRGCSDSRSGSRVRVHQTVTLLAPESTQEYTSMTLSMSATNVRSDVSPRCLAPSPLSVLSAVTDAQRNIVDVGITTSIV